MNFFLFLYSIDLNSSQSNSNDLVKVHEGIKNVLNVSDTSVYEPTNQKVSFNIGKKEA